MGYQKKGVMCMEYNDMLKFIYEERRKMDDAVNAILQKCGRKVMRLVTPAADPKKLKQQGCLFCKVKVTN